MKRLFCLGSIVVLLLTVVVGCGNDDGSTIVSKQSQEAIELNTIEYAGEKYYFGKVVDRGEFEKKFINADWITEEKKILSIDDDNIVFTFRNRICQWDPTRWGLGTSEWFIDSIYVHGENIPINGICVGDSYKKVLEAYPGTEIHENGIGGYWIAVNYAGGKEYSSEQFHELYPTAPDIEVMWGNGKEVYDYYFDTYSLEFNINENGKVVSYHFSDKAFLAGFNF